VQAAHYVRERLQLASLYDLTRSGEIGLANCSRLHNLAQGEPDEINGASTPAVLDTKTQTLPDRN
jgi:hypothetical protein